MDAKSNGATDDTEAKPNGAMEDVEVSREVSPFVDPERGMTRVASPSGIRMEISGPVAVSAIVGLSSLTCACNMVRCVH